MVKLKIFIPLFFTFSLFGCSLDSTEESDLSHVDEVFGDQNDVAETEFLPTVQLCFNQKEVCYEVEVAQNDEDRTRGLMFREEMPENHGMLFVYDHEFTPTFWMKNTLMPLDIVWFNDEKIIVDITSNVVPCEKDPCKVYYPNEQTQYVLELNAGQIDEKGLRIGDLSEFSSK